MVLVIRLLKASAKVSVMTSVEHLLLAEISAKPCSNPYSSSSDNLSDD